MTTENTANKLYWQSNLYPEGKVEVQVTLSTYADNDNLYVGLIYCLHRNLKRHSVKENNKGMSKQPKSVKASAISVRRKKWAN